MLKTFQSAEFPMNVFARVIVIRQLNYRDEALAIRGAKKQARDRERVSKGECNMKS